MSNEKTQIVVENPVVTSIGSLGVYFAAYRNEGDSEETVRNFVINLDGLSKDIVDRNLSEEYVNGVLEGLQKTAELFISQYNLTNRSVPGPIMLSTHFSHEQYKELGDKTGEGKLKAAK